MDENKSYYECKRCFHKFYQKNDMKRHLEKKKLCIRTLESHNINQDKIVELSLIRHKKIECNYNCKYCNKSFSHSNNLNRHVKSFCLMKNNILEDKEKEELIEASIINNDEKINKENISINNSEVNNSNINSNNINIGNISININLLKSFDEDWDLSEIDINKKLVLLLNNSKFTKTLENILENEVNLNVIIDNTSDNGLVYKNKELVAMNIKDIIKKSMEKLHKYLCDFHKDVINPMKIDITDNTINILKDELQTVNKKYDDFKNNEKIQDTVNEFFTNIYNSKKETTVKKCNQIINNGNGF